jgi:phosphoribosylglycinamide formyltransferase
VVAEVDRGKPIIQEAVPLKHPEDDDIEKLEKKIHNVEHALIVKGTLLAIAQLKSKDMS